MPHISDKALHMPSSPIRKLVPFAEAAKKKGIKIYHLNIGQPDIETPIEFLNAVKTANINVLEYSHSAGNESYRKKLSSYYSGFDIHIDDTDIMVTCGGSEAIAIAMLTCFNAGDEVIVPEPFYANYNGFSATTNCKLVPITTTIQNNFALPSISEFEKKINSKTKGILICNPGNPTGAVYSKEELQALCDLVKKHDLYLLSDEVYKEFCYDGKPFFSVMQLAGIEENTILLDSISKRYSACGARIGTLISKNKTVMSAALKFAQTRLSPPSYGQIGAEAALNTPKSYFEKVNTEYVKRRNYLVTELNKIEGVFCPMPSGAFYCIAQLPIDNADNFCQWLLESFSYNGKTVMLAPASGFYSSPHLGKQEVRLAYVLNLDDLKESVICLKEALKQYPNIVR